MRQGVLRVIIEKPFHPLIIFTYHPKAFTTSVSFLTETVMLNVLCQAVCGLTFLEDDFGKPWACCDGCQSWFDFKCTALANPERVPRKFFCHSCM